MEATEYSPELAKKFLVEQYTEQGDFLEIFPPETLESLVGELMSLDEAYMQESGVNDGAIYDDDDAYDYMHERLCAAHPEHKMYMMRLVEDYMDYNERYLESIGAIEWE